jgi:hypothetical protein
MTIICACKGLVMGAGRRAVAEQDGRLHDHEAFVFQ